MGFFKNIFGHKKGGSFVGNALRGASSAFTGGLLGSGAGLANWEQSQAIEEAKDEIVASNTGREVGRNVVEKVLAPAVASGPSNQPKIGQSIFLESLKKYWYFIVLGIVAIVLTMWLILKPKNNHKRIK